MKYIKLAVILCLIASQSSVALAESPVKSEVSASKLHEIYHRFESLYQVSQVQSQAFEGKSTLQNIILAGDYALTPQVSLLLSLPIVTLSNQVALSNPFIGARASIFEGLVKDFPTFINFKGGVRVPLASNKEFVFNRTDVVFGFSSLREIHHLSLSTDLQYVVKIDSNTQERNYGNEWSAKLGGELNTGYNFSPGMFVNYRRAGALREKGETLSGRSLMILQPSFSYHYGSDTTFKANFSTPLGRQNLKDTLKTFGDYTISGIGGNTLFLSFEKKF